MQSNAGLKKVTVFLLGLTKSRIVLDRQLGMHAKDEATGLVSKVNAEDRQNSAQTAHTFTPQV